MDGDSVGVATVEVPEEGVAKKEERVERGAMVEVEAVVQEDSEVKEERAALVEAAGARKACTVH